MQPTEEQLTALGNYRDIIDQHLPEIAESIRVPRHFARLELFSCGLRLSFFFLWL